MPEKSGPTYPIDAVDRALRLILLFGEIDHVSVSEAGRYLGVSRSTAYRTLDVLKHRDFVRQDPRTKVYYGGSALLQAGLAAARRSDLRADLHPLLEEIVKEVDETAHTVVLQGTEAFFLDCQESSRIVRAVSRAGSALPAHCTSGGKVLLAQLPDDQVDRLLPTELSKLTRRSKGSPRSVKRELATVRKRGYAFNDEESESGLRAVAVLVPGEPSRGGIEAAISVSGPAGRLDTKRLGEIAAILDERISAFGS
jgi:DNA-binding IclR family transcriptional regulator